MPRLETNIMEEESLMQTFDRMIWVNKIIANMDEVAESAPLPSEYKDKERENNQIEDSKDTLELKQIVMTWIIFWCYTFNYQDQSEQQLRVNQCIQVLMKIKYLVNN